MVKNLKNEFESHIARLEKLKLKGNSEDNKIFKEIKNQMSFSYINGTYDFEEIETLIKMFEYINDEMEN